MTTILLNILRVKFLIFIDFIIHNHFLSLQVNLTRKPIAITPSRIAHFPLIVAWKFCDFGDCSTIIFLLTLCIPSVLDLGENKDHENQWRVQLFLWGEDINFKKILSMIKTKRKVIINKYT